MKNQINEIKRMQQLAGIINESQLNEALNKDIKAFGQDLDKNLKAAGFNTIITFQVPSSEQIKKVQDDPKSVLLYVTLDDQYQGLQLRGNFKSAKVLDKIVNKFQVADWNGPEMTFGSGWDTKTKQVIGGFNPGDIVGSIDPITGDQNRPFYDARFYRYAITQTKVKTTGYGEETKSQGVTQTVNKPAPVAESFNQLDEVVKEILKEVNGPNAQTSTTSTPSPKQTADVTNLTKLISNNTALINKLKTINNGQEVTEFLTFILNNINDKASGVQKSKIISIINDRFK